MINGDSDDEIAHFKFADDKTIAIIQSDDSSKPLHDRLKTISSEAKENSLVVNAKKVSFNNLQLL